MRYSCPDATNGHVCALYGFIICTCTHNLYVRMFVHVFLDAVLNVSVLDVVDPRQHLFQAKAHGHIHVYTHVNTLGVTIVSRAYEVSGGEIMRAYMYVCICICICIYIYTLTQLYLHT